MKNYQTILATLQKNLEAAGIPNQYHEESVEMIPQIRIVLGLEEGYFEGRKKEVLALADRQAIDTVPELEEALTRLIGDYRTLGIDISAATDFQSALDTLKQTPLAKLHNVREVRSFLGDQFQVAEARVFSAAPDYATPYQEPAAIITAPATKECFEKLLALADLFKQARFSIENLASGLVVNAEILAFSQDISATLI